MSKKLVMIDLLGLHGDLDEMFFEHQKALLHMDFEKALRLLRLYRDALFEHMQDEEEGGGAGGGGRGREGRRPGIILERA
ncbi:MAG: hypothetical protein IPM25_14320 [Chloracidobacterium sp.]|nr:hypothetical protein [Chloracidobacterium sp.]